MLVPFDPNNIHYLEQQASEALKMNDMNKYHQFLNKIKLVQNVQKCPMEKKISEEQPTTSSVIVQTDEESEILRLPVISDSIREEPDNVMDMSIIPVDSEQVIKEQQQIINDLEKKLNNYRAILRKPKANAKVQTDFDVPNKKRKHDGYESEENRNERLNKYEKLLQNPNNTVVKKTSIPPTNIKHQKFLQLLQEHAKVPKSRYSYNIEKRSEIDEEDISEDEDGKTSYFALSNTDLNSRKGPQWKNFK